MRWTVARRTAGELHKAIRRWLPQDLPHYGVIFGGNQMPGVMVVRPDTEAVRIAESLLPQVFSSSSFSSLAKAPRTMGKEEKKLGAGRPLRAAHPLSHSPSTEKSQRGIRKWQGSRARI